MSKYFTPHFVFLSIATLFGCLLCVLVPPFQSPDEINHFYKAIHVSEGHFWGERTNDNRLGGQIPTSIIRFSALYQPMIHNDSLCHFVNQTEAKNISWNADNQSFMDFANTAFYAPIAYIPQAMAVWISQKIDANIYTGFLMARLFNFLIWLLLVYQSIRIAPFGKWVLVVVALLPSSLAFHASCNPDVMVHGLAFWLFAFSLKNHEKLEKLSNIQQGFGLLAVGILTLQKVIFFPFIFLFFSFNKVLKKQLFFIKILIINILILIFLFYNSKNSFITYDDYNAQYRDTQTLNEGVAPMSQLHFIAQNPFFFTKITLLSFIKSTPATLAHFVGKFAWVEHYLPAWQIAACLLALFLIIINEKNIDINRAKRVRWLSVSLLFFMSFSALMYMLWCPVGASVLSNLQGRYFIGIVPLLAFSMLGLKPISDKIPLFSISILIIANIHLIYLVYKLYLINN